MRLARWLEPEGRVRIGRVDGDRLVPLADVNPDRPNDDIIALAMTREALPPAIGPAIGIGLVRLLPPVVRPGLLRDFSAFEKHARAVTQGLTGKDLPESWYQTPVGFFSNPHRIFGNGDLVPVPQSDELDYELECAAVIGLDAADLPPERAHEAIAGYTIFNDWSARDIQRHEKSLGGGAATKSKDFANSLGPWLVTPDELRGAPGRPEATMVARVNGREYSRGDLGDMHFSFAELVAYTSRDAGVRRGDVIGSGTCGTGCIFERSLSPERDQYPWLREGDIVELEVEGIGILTNVVGFRSSDPRAMGGAA